MMTKKKRKCLVFIKGKSVEPHTARLVQAGRPEGLQSSSGRRAPKRLLLALLQPTARTHREHG